MLDNVDGDTEQDLANNRGRLNAALLIESWPTPLSRFRPAPRPEEGPWWWRGEEDASASFFAGMGIDPKDL